MLISPRSHTVSTRLHAQRTAFAIGLALLVGADSAAAQRKTVVSSASRPHRQRAAKPACDSGWSSLRELRTPTRQRVYVEAPVTVTNTVGTFLIGSPTLVWADTSAFI